MNLISRLFDKKPSATSTAKGDTVTFDDERIVRTMQNGRQETIRWSELRNVTIMTTDEGPFEDDVFWVLSGTQTGCLVPSEAEGMKELLPRLQQLPGFDNEAVIRAMGSTANERFLCWQEKDGLSSSSQRDAAQQSCAAPVGFGSHMKQRRSPNLIGYLLLAILFVVGPFFWKMDVGGRVLSTAEAWETGAAQTTVAMGILLLVLTAFLWRGALWPRWLVVAWCPFGILCGLSWSMVTGIGKINPIEVGLLSVPVMVFWMWATWRHLFEKSQ